MEDAFTICHLLSIITFSSRYSFFFSSVYIYHEILLPFFGSDSWSVPGFGYSSSATSCQLCQEPCCLVSFLPNLTAYNSALTFYASGDSYSTVGFWPGGDLPTPGSPLGNPALPGQTTANGLNWVGHLTSTLNTSQVLTYDFAVTGATVSKKIVDTYAQFCVDDQVAQYKEYVSKKISTADTLVAVWIGINDLGEPFWKKTSPPIEKTLDRYFELLKTLSETGLKKFALLTVPRKFSRYSCGAHTNHSSSILRPNPSHD